MILTCPECATGYFVDDAQIKPEGRTVRCAACGARWTAYPEHPLDLVSSEAEGGAAKPAEEAAQGGPLTGEDLPRVFRDRAEEEKRQRQAVTAGVAWGAAAAVIAALLGSGILFREAVVRAWPQTASAYAAIGLPVNPTGLVIEQVRAEPSLQDGHATLAVSGEIRNIVDREVVAPPLRISLFNAQGKRVAGQIATLDNGRIPPGQARHFMTSIFDPPFSAANLQVDFAIGMRAPPGVAHAATSPPATPGFSLRGPAAPAPPQFSAQPLATPPPAPSNAAASPS